MTAEVWVGGGGGEGEGVVSHDVTEIIFKRVFLTFFVES